MARRAEEIGFHSVWLSDRVLNPTALSDESLRRTRPRAMDVTALYYEPLTTMAVIGGATSRIALGVRVLLPALRNPVILAKEIGTLAALIGSDRLMLGVGAGWMSEEFEAAGIHPDDRFAAMEECVAELRNAWSGQPVSFAGRFHRHAESGFGPVPGGRIPILFGAHTEAGLRRVAAASDGWAMRSVTDQADLDTTVRREMDQLRAACDQVGRNFADLTIVASAALSAPQHVFEVLAENGAHVCDLMITRPEEMSLDSAETFMCEVAPRFARSSG
jgi:probable F420-dependent oxidoreductase